MKKCELLAPAGGPEQFVAAVENGADAVYAGGKYFHARMGASNFDEKTLEQAVDYGHLRNVRTYITMNTLMNPEDLKEAVAYAGRLYRIGVDGLIIQDLGLGSVIREKFPDFPLHLSTQATVYNEAGLEAAARLGYSRAVLARELSLKEIERCSQNQKIETEVFVHGALCFCYSGQCQLSRYIGGRSGNKGACAQPCRLAYEYKDFQGRKQEGGPHPLSPKDLCMIDHLGALVEAGVSSLKIEGRMKSPQYVATVVSIYRKYLDQYYEKGWYTVSEQDRLNLMQIFNRGGFTDGYALRDPEAGLMSGMSAKNQGIYVGTILRGTQGGQLVDIAPQLPLKLGDVVEIRAQKDGRATDSTRVTYLKPLEKKTIRIGDFKTPIFPGDKLYRVISEEQRKKAEESFQQISFSDGKFVRKAPVQMVLSAVIGEPLKLQVVDRGVVDLKFEHMKEGLQIDAVLSEIKVSTAEKRVTTREEIREKLSKTGGTPFACESIHILGDENIYIPVSALNQLRRDILESLGQEKCLAFKRTLKEEIKKQEVKIEMLLDQETKKKVSKRMELEFSNWEQFEKVNWAKWIKELELTTIPKSVVDCLLPLREVCCHATFLNEFSKKHGLRIVPFVGNVTKGPTDDWLNSHFEEACKTISNLGNVLYVGNIGWIHPFADQGIDVFGDYGLNITNVETERAYCQLGMKEGIGSLEKDELSLGSYPLMITEHAMENGLLTDRKGVKYQVAYSDETHKTTIRALQPKIDWEQVEKMWMKTTENLRIYGFGESCFI